MELTPQHQAGEHPDLSAAQIVASQVVNPPENYFERLRARPWETKEALQRLHVPERLLPAHCSVITNWVVLTGASCAGKTTIVDALEEMGHRVVHEKATDYVLGEMEKGRSFKEIRADDRAFRREVFRRTLEEELDLLQDSHKIIFFDRAAVDCVSVNRGSGYDPHEIVNELQPYRYACVLVCNPLPFVDNGIRTRNEERRHFLDAAFERDYKALGYNPVRIPIFDGNKEASIKKRLEYLLETLKSTLSRSEANVA